MAPRPAFLPATRVCCACLHRQVQPHVGKLQGNTTSCTQSQRWTHNLQSVLERERQEELDELIDPSLNHLRTSTFKLLNGVFSQVVSLNVDRAPVSSHISVQTKKALVCSSIVICSWLRLHT